jgi:hypothetical protein
VNSISLCLPGHTSPIAASLGERAGVDRVESQPVKQMPHGVHREPVADRGHRNAIGHARRAWVLIELVVAELVQALDDGGGGEVGTLRCACAITR